MIRKSYAVLAGLLGIVAASCTSGGDGGRDQESADLILTNAKIFTSNREQPWAEAVAIKGDRFIYVGDPAGAQMFQSDNTQIVDLDGRLVIPGLVDSHAHPGYIDVEQYGELSATNEASLLVAGKAFG